MNLLEMYKQLTKEEQQELSNLILDNEKTTIKIDGKKTAKEFNSCHLGKKYKSKICCNCLIKDKCNIKEKKIR